jgi:ATP-dependent Lon protease
MAKYLNKKIAVISMAGVDGEELKGFRRTYVNALPGRIIQSVKELGSRNAIILFDEIDKTNRSFYRSNPISVLLEVLDSSQNKKFIDNFLGNEAPFDLSKLIFICTANYEDRLPIELIDRLEIIKISSYTFFERLKIANDYIIPKLNGYHKLNISFSEDSIKELINHYIRESGVRNLQRIIDSIFRKILVKYLEKKEKSYRNYNIDLQNLHEFLDAENYRESKIIPGKKIGLFNLLAFTPIGGMTMPAESKMISVSGKEEGGKLIFTGNAGNTMKESSNIAFNFLRSNKEKLEIEIDFSTINMHLNTLDCVSKDGPSAGAGMAIIMLSSLKNYPLSTSIGITGALTLNGNITRIGGLKEKAMGAISSGIKLILVPEENREDVNKFPIELKENLKILYVNNFFEA